MTTKLTVSEISVRLAHKARRRVVQETTQRVPGDPQHEHSHIAVLHTHDHYHVSHHHTGGPLGEFEHRTTYHQHEHNHAPVIHGHEKQSEDEERREHDSTAHIHDHNAPTGGGL